jgi:hypothetical protein
MRMPSGTRSRRGVDDLAVEFTRPRAARRRPCERRGRAARSARAIACS